MIKVVSKRFTPWKWAFSLTFPLGITRECYLDLTQTKQAQIHDQEQIQNWQDQVNKQLPRGFIYCRHAGSQPYLRVTYDHRIVCKPEIVEWAYTALRSLT